MPELRWTRKICPTTPSDVVGLSSTIRGIGIHVSVNLFPFDSINGAKLSVDMWG
jgi:hypothetical protein